MTTAGRRVDGPYLRVELPPSTLVRLSLELDLRAQTATYRTPFSSSDPRTDPTTGKE